MDSAGATIEAWRARGADRVDPVRFRLIEALVRRAGAHAGEARRIVDDKVALLLAAYGEAIERAEGTPPQPADASSHRGALAELVDHIARHAAAHDDGRAASDAGASAAGDAGELKAMRYFRSTWSRLAADQRLTQSLAKLPENAGPLHSHHLVHRSLTLMRDLSPAYLERFVTYVDALLWLDQAGPASRAKPLR